MPATRPRPLAAVLTTLALVIVACSAPDLQFTIGECINLPDGDQITAFEPVDCVEAHDAEVYALPQHPDGEEAPFPGPAMLSEFASQRCLDAFEDYVGTPYEQSDIFFSPLTPSEESWTEAADREIVCLLRGDSPNGSFEQLTGSKRDSGE